MIKITRNTGSKHRDGFWKPQKRKIKMKLCWLRKRVNEAFKKSRAAFTFVNTSAIKHRKNFTSVAPSLSALWVRYPGPLISNPLLLGSPAVRVNIYVLSIIHQSFSLSLVRRHAINVQSNAWSKLSKSGLVCDIYVPLVQSCSKKEHIIA